MFIECCENVHTQFNECSMLYIVTLNVYRVVRWNGLVEQCQERLYSIGYKEELRPKFECAYHKNPYDCHLNVPMLQTWSTLLLVYDLANCDWMLIFMSI